MVSEKLIQELSELPKSRLVDKNQLPTRMSERKMTPFSFMLMWMGTSILLAVFTNAVNMFPSLGIGQILGAVALGNLITVITLAINGDIGITYGLNFPVYLRSIFGYTGCYVPSVIRAIPACFWYGFQTYLGAEAINMILVKLVPSWPGTYGCVLGIIVIFLTVQCLTTAKGIGAISKFEDVVTPLMFLVMLYLLYFVLNKGGMSAGEILATPAGEVTGTRYSFFYAVTAMTGFWATMALNIPDLTRFVKCNPDEPNWLKRNWCSIWPQLVGIIPMMTLLAFIGAAAMLTSGHWDPIQYIAGMDSPTWLLIVMLLLSVFAQWSSNISSNILPPANIFSTVFAPKVSFPMGCAVAGILAFLMQPWKLIDRVVTANLVVGIMLGGVAGMMIADYYFLHKRKLNIRDFYVEDGEYTFVKGWNPCAFIAYIVGTVGGLLYTDLGFLLAMLVGGVTYYLLMRFWGAKKYNQTSILVNFEK